MHATVKLDKMTYHFVTWESLPPPGQYVMKYIPLLRCSVHGSKDFTVGICGSMELSFTVQIWKQPIRLQHCFNTIQFARQSKLCINNLFLSQHRFFNTAEIWYIDYIILVNDFQHCTITFNCEFCMHSTVSNTFVHQMKFFM